MDDAYIFLHTRTLRGCGDDDEALGVDPLEKDLAGGATNPTRDRGKHGVKGSTGELRNWTFSHARLSVECPSRGRGGEDTLEGAISFGHDAVFRAERQRVLPRRVVVRVEPDLRTSLRSRVGV
jgi:hypothetical protein